MMATNLEYCHQTLVHQFIVGAAFLTYLIDRDDIVWRFVRNGSTPRLWERSLFIVATILITGGAGRCTPARALHRPGPHIAANSWTQSGSALSCLFQDSSFSLPVNRFEYCGSCAARMTLKINSGGKRVPQGGNKVGNPRHHDRLRDYSEGQSRGSSCCSQLFGWIALQSGLLWVNSDVWH